MRRQAINIPHLKTPHCRIEDLDSQPKTDRFIFDTDIISQFGLNETSVRSEGCIYRTDWLRETISQKHDQEHLETIDAYIRLDDELFTEVKKQPKRLYSQSYWKPNMTSIMPLKRFLTCNSRCVLNKTIIVLRSASAVKTVT